MAETTIQSSKANTPSVQTVATALAANAGRNGFSIQNQGTNVLFVCLAAGGSTSQYHATLAKCTVAADGLGGSLQMFGGSCYTGIVTVAGTSPSYTVFEY